MGIKKFFCLPKQCANGETKQVEKRPGQNAQKAMEETKSGVGRVRVGEGKEAKVREAGCVVPPRTLDENFYNNHLETTDGRSLCPPSRLSACQSALSVAVLGVDSERKTRCVCVCECATKWNNYIKQ